MVQKMQHYIKAFSKEDETEAKTDTMKGLIPTLPQPGLKDGEGFPDRKSVMFGQEEPEDDQDIKYL